MVCIALGFFVHFVVRISGKWKSFMSDCSRNVEK